MPMAPTRWTPGWPSLRRLAPAVADAVPPTAVMGASPPRPKGAGAHHS
jgi:hypothetical protein